MTRSSRLDELLPRYDFGEVHARVIAAPADPDGYTRIETETRVLATDSRSRREFARYWRLIRPPSDAIRRVRLCATAWRADLRGRQALAGKPMLRRVKK